MLKFEKVKTELVYKANRVRVYKDILRTPSGRLVEYDLVKNRDGAGILLVDNDKNLIFIRQYRNVTDDLSIEIPAGCKEFPEENPEVCALREAEEETGLIPEKLYFINTVVAAIGVLDEKTSVYIGTNLKKGNINRDADEYMEIVKMTHEEALNSVYSNKITDSKTVIAILAYTDMKSRNIL